MTQTLTREKTFRIEGIDCAACAPKIEDAVARVKGVASVQVLLGTSRLVVRYEGDLDVNAVLDAVAAAGYKARLEEAHRSIALFVEGMDCVDELGPIEKKLRGLAGVSGYQVNLVNQKIDVSFDPERVTANDIMRAIAETGMKPRLERRRTTAKPWWQDDRVRLIFVSGVLLIAGFAVEKLVDNRLLSNVLYGAAIVAGGYFPGRMVIAGLRSRTLNIYMLLAIAVAGALVLGFWGEAALLVLAYTWGAVMETFALERARGSLRALMDLVPREALVRRDNREVVVTVEQVQVGEIAIIRPGERVPLDGVVVSGTSAVDQAPITGESIPVPKGPNDTVLAGSINQRGSLDLRVVKAYQDTTLARVVHMVERAEARKSSYQHFSERFGRIYTPLIFFVAVTVAIVPWLLGQPFVPWFYRALVVLVVSCSCGLALSVPMAVLSSVSNAARRGILIKGGADLEAVGNIDVVVFDKTGTLTIGRPVVTDIIPLDHTGPEMLGIAASVESRSEHPLAEAITRKAREEGLEVTTAHQFEALPGFGARASVGGKTYYVCSKRLCEQLAIPTDKIEKDLQRLESEGKSIDIVTDEKRVLGVLAVADQLRPEAKAAIEALRAAGVKRVVMLTGDNEGTAKHIAAQAGVDEYRAQLLPDDKVAAVKDLKAKYGRVAMVGDGVNDAPAMLAADVGIAMGAAGTDVAMETGDLALMSDDLSRVPEVFQISRRAVRNIRQNIVASLAVVAIVITLALMGAITLVTGVVVNEGSALLVMANALRLLRG